MLYIESLSVNVLYGFQLIHPFKNGHLLVKVNTYPYRGSSIAITSRTRWENGGWQGKSDVDVKQLLPIKDIEKALMGDKPVEVVSTLSPRGEYELHVNGKLSVTATVEEAEPLDLSRPKAKPKSSFRGEGLPMLLKKGQAGIIVAPTDGQYGVARDIMLRSAKKRDSAE